MFAEKIMDFFCALQSTQRMALRWREIVATAALLAYRLLQKITKPTQPRTYFNRGVSAASPSEVSRASAGLGGVCLRRSRSAEY